MIPVDPPDYLPYFEFASVGCNGSKLLIEFIGDCLFPGAGFMAESYWLIGRKVCAFT